MDPADTIDFASVAILVLLEIIAPVHDHRAGGGPGHRPAPGR